MDGMVARTMKRLFRVGLILFALAVVPVRAAVDYSWAVGVGGPSLGDNVTMFATAVDTNGNVFTTGDLQGSTDFGGGTLTSAGDRDVFVMKRTAAGAFSWAIRVGGTGADRGFGVGTDSTGNVYVTGQFQNTVNFGGGNVVSAGNADIFVLKLTNAGAFTWVKRFGSTGNDVANGISVASSGTFAITGFFGQFGDGKTDFGGGSITNVGGGDIFVAEYASDGTFAWARTLGGTPQDVGLSVAVDSTGVAAVTGYFQGTITLGCGTTMTSAGGRDGIVAEYSSTGVLLWVRRFGSPGDVRGIGIALRGGVVAITGYFNGAVDFGGGVHASTGGGVDIFVATYASAGGAWTWDRVYGSPSGFGDLGNAVAIDSGGNVIITGNILNNLDLGGGGSCPSCGTYDVFVLKLSSIGAYVVDHRYSTTTYDEHGYGVAVDAADDVILVGDYFNTVDFGGGLLTNHGGGTSGFVALFTP